MILSLDPATDTGWAVLSDSGERVEGGVWNLGEDLNQALFEVNRLVSLLLDMDSEVMHVVIEQMSVFRGGDTTRKLCGIEAAIKIAVMQSGLAFTMYRPTEWRKVLNLKSGTNKKKIARDYVESIFGERYSEDESDAICVGLAYLKELKGAIEDEQEKP